MLLVVLLGFAACKPAVVPPPPPTPSPTPVAVPTPTPMPTVARKPLSIARLFNGLGLETRVIAEPSEELASADRRDIDAYRVEVTLRAKLPRAATKPEDFARTNPMLGGTFRDFGMLLAGGAVSPAFAKIYELKVADLERDIVRLDTVLQRHNFYDCETILDLENPSTGRRAILAVGDMDVNVDGSDGDRNVQVDGSSEFFLPQTSYRWLKRTERENPFVAVEQARMKSLQAELGRGGVSPARRAEIDSGVALAKRRIFDLKKWSFLVSETDPFIVLPGFMMRDTKGPTAPGIGDFALVLINGKAYPAIVGDAGPSLKIGEASLRICREINPRSSALQGAIGDLRAGYLVFPGTADESPGPPDLSAWRRKCEAFAAELGGLAVAVHDWPEVVKPWPTPIPSPSPAMMPMLEASPTPGAGSSPDPSASPI